MKNQAEFDPVERSRGRTEAAVALLVMLVLLAMALAGCASGPQPNTATLSFPPVEYSRGAVLPAMVNRPAEIRPVAAAAKPITLTLFWDPPAIGASNVTQYCVYQLQGTNWSRIWTTANTNLQMGLAPGCYTFTVTADSWWGESDYATPVTTPVPAGPPGHVGAQRVP